MEGGGGEGDVGLGWWERNVTAGRHHGFRGHVKPEGGHVAAEVRFL